MNENTRKNLVFVWLTILTILTCLQFRGNARLDELTVQRINILEPNGNPRMIISNSARFPGIYMNAKEYRHGGRESGKVATGGFLYFNDDGDEAGGLITSSSKEEGNRSATINFSFDKLEQDQIMSLNYTENKNGQSAGLQVTDQPDGNLNDLLELSDKLARAQSEEERTTIKAEMSMISKKTGRFAQRFFAGKFNGDSVVELKDRKGKTRLLLKVDKETGTPSIEFLAPDGKVTKRL